MIQAHIAHQWPGFKLNVEFASKGPVLGVFGHSGSGKSSLLHCLSGWLKPREAKIEILGKRICDLPGGLHTPIDSRGLAVVPQDPLLFPHRSTRANLAFAPNAAKQLATDRGRSIVDWLRLGPLLERRTDTLSGGEQQRVALGRAWLSNPAMVLLDEPASSLDSEMADEVIALLREAKNEWNIPMVFVTHRSSELLALADDCLLLEKGSIVAQGPPLQVLADPLAHEGNHWNGVENLLQLPVLSHDESNGVTLADLGAGVVLAIPICATPVGARVHMSMRGEDILLAQESPGPTSARNDLPALIQALTGIGQEVLVDLLVGQTHLQARVTPGAVQALSMATGQEVRLLIKSTACRPLLA